MRDRGIVKIFGKNRLGLIIWQNNEAQLFFTSHFNCYRRPLPIEFHDVVTFDPDTYEMIFRDKQGVQRRAKYANDSWVVDKKPCGSVLIQKVAHEALQNIDSAMQKIYDAQQYNDEEGKCSVLVLGKSQDHKPLLYVKGSNSKGQLGLGHSEPQNEFVAVQLPDDVLTVSNMHATATHTIIVGRNRQGHIKLWAAGEINEHLLSATQRNNSIKPTFIPLKMPLIMQLSQYKMSGILMKECSAFANTIERDNFYRPYNKNCNQKSVDEVCGLFYKYECGQLTQQDINKAQKKINWIYPSESRRRAALTIIGAVAGALALLVLLLLFPDTLPAAAATLAIIGIVVVGACVGAALLGLLSSCLGRNLIELDMDAQRASSAMVNHIKLSIEEDLLDENLPDLNEKIIQMN